jgi:hypothetical protein
MDRWLWDVWPGFGARACSNLLKPLRGTWWNHADEIVSQSQLFLCGLRDYESAKGGR